MIIISSKPKPRNKSPDASPLLQNNTEAYLRSVVEKIAVPRHYTAEPANNTAIGHWIEQEFNNLGLQTFRQGRFANVVATAAGSFNDCSVLIGAHFDSVPRSPGADDNASAVAGMLAAARALVLLENPAVAFVAFNREEDDLLGSTDFVHSFLRRQKHKLRLVHVLEMIGYCDHSPGSQRVPPGLPIKLSDKADFLGIIANRYSNRYASSLIKTAENTVPSLPVKVLKVYFGLERYFPHLLRSDHTPFWREKIPALMWTDTSEFRNPHYHRPSDTPDTLDFHFLKLVSDLLISQVANYLTESAA